MGMDARLTILFDKISERPLIPSAIVMFVLIMITYFSGSCVGSVLIALVLTALLIFIRKEAKIALFLSMMIIVSAILSVILSLRLESATDKDINSGTARIISVDRKLDRTCRFKVRLESGRYAVINDKTGMIDLYPGDLFYYEGNIKLPDKATNPGEFDYSDYLKKQGVSYVLSVDHLEKVSDAGVLYFFPNQFSLFVYKIRLIVSDLIINNSDDNEGPLIVALCLGDTSFLSSDIKSSFSLASCSHLIAVSGTHFTGFLTFFAFIEKDSSKKRSYRYVMLVLYIAVGFMTGFRESVTRACTMCVCSLFSRDRVSGICLAAIIMMIADPFAALSSGFQMSIGATLGIMIFAQKIKTYLILRNLGEKLSSMISVAVASHIGLLPFFEEASVRLSPMNFLCQIIGSILVSIICIIFVPVLLFCFAGFDFAFWPVEVLYKLLDIVVGIAAQNSGFAVNCGRYGTYCFWGLYILLLILIMPDCIFRKIMKIPAYSAGALSVGILLFELVFPTGLSVVFIDVGQGDSCLIMTPEHCVLIDGGKYEAGESVEGVLNWYGIDKVDIAFVTHWDEDHCGGICYLYHNGRIKDVCSPVKCPEILKNEHYIESVTITHADTVFDIGSGSYISVLGPLTITDDSNEDSLVLELNHNGWKVLFTGDIGFDTECKLISEGVLDDCDVLKVAHHGSRYSTGNEFLGIVKPEIAVVSVGYHNSYGHPAKETVERLRENGCKIERTDYQGAITFEIQ